MGDSSMITDRLELPWSAIAAVLFVGLSSGVSDDSSCLARVAALSACFTTVAVQLRRHILTNYTNPSTPADRGVMREMVVNDLRSWVHDLVRLAHQVRPEVVLPPPCTVLDTPPVPVLSLIHI